MTILQKLGEKCTSTKCTKCPVWQFNNEGGKGDGLHNNCVESLRFRVVYEAMQLFLSGKEYDRQSLKGEFDEDEDR